LEEIRRGIKRKISTLRKGLIPPKKIKGRNKKE
jgi:hypothetical protein